MKCCWALNPRTSPSAERGSSQSPESSDGAEKLPPGAAGILGQEGRECLRKGQGPYPGRGHQAQQEISFLSHRVQPTRCPSAMTLVLPPSSPLHLLLPHPHLWPEHPQATSQGCHQHLRPQNASWEKQALSLTWEIQLGVPVMEFECCRPQETDGQHGLRAQSSGLRNRWCESKLV